MSRFHDAIERARTDSGETRSSGGDTTVRAPRQKVRVPGPVHPAYERIVQGLLTKSNRHSPALLVASAISGEGTSTVARNLAAALSQAARTVLVDANLRSPTQHDAFGVARNGGLSDVVAGTLKLDSALRNGDASGFAVLASGSPARSPSQLLSQPTFRRLLDELRAQYRFVILDGPPITVYPDAGSLAALADGVVMVMRAEHTRWEVAEEAKRAIEQSGTPILGAVLNRRKYHIPQRVYERL